MPRILVWSLAFALAFFPTFAGAQSPVRAFPPSTFQSRGAIDAAAGGGGGNVTADVIGTKKFQATSNSFSYTGLTITAGLTKPALVCWVMRKHGSNDVTVGVALSWGAQSMTLIKEQDNDGGVQNDGVFLFGLRNPTSGNQTLTVSATNVATDNFVNCVSFSNVNQTSDAAAFPNATGANTATSINVTSAAGHIAVGAFDNGSVNGTIIGTTVIDDSSSGGLISAGGDYVASTGASTTVGESTLQTNLAGMDISN